MPSQRLDLLSLPHGIYLLVDDEARAALVRLCGRLRDHAERINTSKSGGPL